jgi:hypothetical protein
MDQEQHTIHTRQNESPFREILAAAFYFDSQLKRLYTFQVFITVPIPILLAVSATVYPRSRVFAALYGLIATILDVAFLENHQKKLKRQNAKLLELFDCELLRIPWPEFKAGQQPSHGDILESANKFIDRGSGLHRLDYWYTEGIRRLPLFPAKLVCQQINIWWPKAIRDKYISILRTALIIMSIVVLTIPVALHMSMEDSILSIMAPLFPAVLWLIREMHKQTECFNRLERLMEQWKNTWDRLVRRELNNDHLSKAIRDIQDALYDHLCAHPPMFRWIHNLYDKRYHSLMKEEVRFYADQYIQSVPSGENKQSTRENTGSFPSSG